MIERIGRNTISILYKKEKLIFSIKEYQEIIRETKSLIKDFNEDFLINFTI